MAIKSKGLEIAERTRDFFEREVEKLSRTEYKEAVDELGAMIEMMDDCIRDEEREEEREVQENNSNER